MKCELKKMGKALKVEVVRKESIKPSSPRGEEERSLKLSVMDQVAPSFHTRILLMYEAGEGDEVINGNNKKKERIERVKTSLRDTLCEFYPLAGRVKDNAVIECNDEGGEWYEAEVEEGVLLRDILKQPPDVEVIRQLVPPAEPETEEEVLLLKVQVSVFQCGGLGIGVSISHKIADASTIASFIKAWSATSSNSITTLHALRPTYVLPSLFPPPRDMPVLPPFHFKHFDHCLTKRFVFEWESIRELKSKCSGTKMVEQVTRVEVVSALLWKCAAKASRTRHAQLGMGSCRQRRSMLSQFVNIRKRTTPPLGETSVGNLVGHFIAEADSESDDMELPELVSAMRKGLDNFSNIQVPMLQQGNVFAMLCQSFKDGELAYDHTIDFYACTSWCRFSFYQADFGWGNPIWVTTPSFSTLNNTFILMDTATDGIQAWVTLNHHHMALMQTDPLLLHFASLNPPIL